MPVQYIQRCDEELVGVLLLVACEVACVSPHQVQQPEGNVGRTVARVELRAGKEDGRGGGEEEERVVSLFLQVLLGALYSITSLPGS